MNLFNEEIYLYHYYEKSVGPFVNLSEIDIENAIKIQNNLKNVFASKEIRII